MLRAFVAASDDDYRLRCAPERYRMRVFRDFAKDIGDIAEAGARVNFVFMPDFLNGVGEALKVIIEVGNRMQGICRWYPPTTAGRSRRRRWLQGCKEVHQASWKRLLVEARRMERHAKRSLTARASASLAKPATSPRVGLFASGQVSARPSRRNATRANVARSAPLHLRRLAELLPQVFGFGLVAMLYRPFKEQVGPLDLLDEIVPLRHCYRRSSFSPCREMVRPHGRWPPA